MEYVEQKKSKLPIMAVLAIAAFAFAAFVPVGNATLLTYLVQLLGGNVTVTPAFSQGANFTSAAVVASMPANVTGSIINNLAATSRPLSVTLTPASGTLAYGAANDITSMDLVVDGVSHTFLSGECVGGATLVCTTIAPMSLASGANTVDVLLTPHMLFDPAQSPVGVSVSVD